MKTKHLLGLLIVFIGCISCGGVDTYYSKHYVVKYYDTESIELKHDFGGWTDGVANDYYYETFGYKLVDIWIKPYSDNTIHEYDQGRTIGGEEYLALCEKHGDMSYNREVYRGAGRRNTNLDFTNVSVISDVDYDEEHLTGSELGDIVRFKTQSPINYIRNGYTGSEILEIYKLVSELIPDDLVLIGLSDNGFWLASLEFFSEPTLSKTHNITVTMTADDGRVFSDTVQVSWE